MAKELIGNSIELSNSVTIIPRLSEYKNELRLDIREFVKTEKYTGPTKKGVNLPADKLDELITALVALKEGVASLV